MRRIDRDYIAAIDCARGELERYMAGNLQCTEAVPPVFTGPVASIREIRRIEVRPRLPADYPTVDVVVAMHASITARRRQRGVDLGTRTILVDVELDALGAVVGHGYDLVPQRAPLTAWWGG